jgi:Sigma-70 region 2
MTTPSGPGGGRPDPGLDAIMGERRQLINLTYRLLGSLAEAEDAVQETYARWYALSRQQQDAIEVVPPNAYGLRPICARGSSEMSSRFIISHSTPWTKSALRARRRWCDGATPQMA